MKKIVGLLIVICIIFGALVVVGPELFNDIHSLLFVLGGATGYSLIKSKKGNWVKDIGDGGVYFGWLGTLIGLISIAGNRFDVWGDVDKMGPALAVAMLTIFYGYLLKLLAMTFEQ
jgi:flagellar motor component MotA